MRTIALYTTETMADWEYAYLTTQITGAEHLKPGRFRLPVRPVLRDDIIGHPLHALPRQSDPPGDLSHR